jgi:RNA polymerase sigma-70 factor (ECF subfamily)
MSDSNIVHKKFQSNTKSKYPNDLEQTMWLTQTKNGDSMAFSYIVDKYQRPVYNLCYRMLNKADDAEDAAQEIFIRAYSKLDSYDGTGKFSTWLFSIASHYCIDKLRKHHFKLVPWDDLGSWYHFPEQDTAQPEKVLIEAEATQAVRTLLEVLPPDYRMAIILKYWYAMPYQEIAQTLETTVSAIKSKLFRARKMMAAQATPSDIPSASYFLRNASARYQAGPRPFFTESPTSFVR